MKRIVSHLLTKDKDTLVLGRGNFVGQRVNKNAINKLQAIPWELNENILHLLTDTLKPSSKPLSAIEEKERVKSYKLRDKETNNVIDYLLENGNKFYFGWKYDKRGRMYSQGYHCNIQGNEYRKAMLSFSDKELLTSEGMTYLKIDIANCLGYDKDVWFKRITEANKVIKEIFINNEINEEALNKYIAIADTPQLLIKAIYAWYEGVIKGNPIGHNMGLDATASGESPSLTGMLF